MVLLSLTSNPSTYVKFHHYADKLQETICKSENWTQETFHRIDWEAYKKAFSTFSRCQRISISKLSHKLLNTNSQNNKYYGTSALCPCCQMEPESFNHMLSCSSDAPKAYRTSQLQELKSKLTQIGTPEDITISILHGIENWEISMYETSFCQRAPTCGSVRPTDILITQAYTEQRHIGWDSFLRGRITKLWNKAYQHVYTKANNTTSSTSWSSKLIKVILDYSFSLWEYRNGVLHGHTIEENEAKESEKISSQIRTAYMKYQEDPHIIPSRW